MHASSALWPDGSKHRVCPSKTSPCLSCVILMRDKGVNDVIPTMEGRFAISFGAWGCDKI